MQQEVFPAINMIPKSREDVKIGVRYICPVYKTQERKEMLTIIANCNNNIFTILLNTDHSVSHWIKRGVALICQHKD